MFGKIEVGIWDSPKIRALDDACKLAFIYLIANKHGNVLGYYLLPLPYMADDLGWSIDRVKKVMGKLEAHGFISYDPHTRIVWIRNYLRYHTIKKNQTEISAVEVLKALPRSPLLEGLYAVVKEEYPAMKFCSYLSSLVTESSLWRDETVTDQSPNGDISISISTSRSKSISKSNGYTKEFEEFWSVFKELGRAEGKPLTFEHWNATLAGRDGPTGHPPVPAETIIQAARNYAAYCKENGTERRFIMQASSFVGPKKRGWEAYLKPVVTTAEDRHKKLVKWIEGGDDG